MPGRRASHDVAGVFAGAVISMLVIATASSGSWRQEQSAKEGTPAAAAGPAIDVAAAAAAEIEWQEKIISIGVAEAVQGVDVSGSEAGVVAEILFDSGSEAKSASLWSGWTAARSRPTSRRRRRRFPRPRPTSSASGSW